MRIKQTKKIKQQGGNTMYKVGKFEGATVIKRDGVMGEIIDLAPEARLSQGVLNMEDKKMEVSEGQGVYLVTDEFGLVVNEKELTNVDIMFVNGGALVYLTGGKIVVEGKIIDMQGNEKEVEKERVDVVNVSSLRGSLGSIIKHKYSLETEEELDGHVNNLLFTVELYANLPIMKAVNGKGVDTTANSPVRNTKILNWSEQMGLGEFNFKE